MEQGTNLAPLRRERCERFRAVPEPRSLSLSKVPTTVSTDSGGPCQPSRTGRTQPNPAGHSRASWQGMYRFGVASVVRAVESRWCPDTLSREHHTMWFIHGAGTAEDPPTPEQVLQWQRMMAPPENELPVQRQHERPAQQDRRCSRRYHPARGVLDGFPIHPGRPGPPSAARVRRWGALHAPEPSPPTRDRDPVGQPSAARHRVPRWPPGFHPGGAWRRGSGRHDREPAPGVGHPGRWRRRAERRPDLLGCAPAA